MTHVRDPNGSYDGSYSLLPSTKETTAACVDRPTKAGIVATLYDRLESYEEIVRRFGSLKDALKEEKHRSDRLEQELNTLRDVGIQLSGYVKNRFDRLFSSIQKAHQCSKEYEGVLNKQEDRVVKIHDLENEIERSKTSLSETVSSDPEKSRRDQTAIRASLKKQYRQEVNSINQKLKSRISQLESIRALLYADAKKY